MSRACFITANDTDAGKSYLAALLLRALLQRGMDVAALKPVACGVADDGVNGDVALLQRLQPQLRLGAINLHTNPQPLAPLFDQPVERERLLAWCGQRISQQRITLIEGVGGLMVPLNTRFTQLDWLLALPELTIVLVVRARLGCLSQVLSHLALLDHCERPRIWLVVNAVRKSDLPYAEQCLQVVDQWHPWVKVALLGPDAETAPDLTDWICRGL
ncbi:MAG: ATP-dependent dethiobiotin synthetase BioD [Mariprofundales bacterium]